MGSWCTACGKSEWDCECHEDEDDFEMPTPCQHCGKIFDLNDGVGSTRWHPNTVICGSCGKKEDDEIEQDEEIQHIQNSIEDAEFTIIECLKRAKELDFKPVMQLNIHLNDD